jgi:hypothetical protein
VYSGCEQGQQTPLFLEASLIAGGLKAGAAGTELLRDEPNPGPVEVRTAWSSDEGLKAGLLYGPHF